ncbi:polyamine ABC transporter ATP-binding protein [Phenylobacterium sp. J367]|uniref:polyamine ABC transporter ATP-binding protein n=1 Tax=Phenylobacterium sp. J367 TaxID=2898435 RepID=UPI002151B153|nr:polyamine ABC transporter ATP-binding protein [Phenylobacterium sp. J367]MCR5880820.1 polyamine ABC transporter ATP-binding protein [Phenylobacterium sp. J367]
MVPSNHNVPRYIQAGALAPLDKAKLTGLSNLDPETLRHMSPFDREQKYTVPYMQGTIGIGYNAKAVAERLPGLKVDSWKVVFDPANLAKLENCGVYFLDASEDMYAVALHYLGKDPNSSNPADYQAATEMLLKARPYVRKFHSSEYIDALANGDICMAIGYSGDVLQAADRAEEAKNGVEVAYAIPKEGTQVWFDVFAIPRGRAEPGGGLQVPGLHAQAGGDRPGLELHPLRQRQRGLQGPARRRGAGRSRRLSAGRGAGADVRHHHQGPGAVAPGEPPVDPGAERPVSGRPPTNGRLVIGAIRDAFAPWEDPNARPLLRFEGVSKRFGEVVAVDGVDLAIHEREFFALLGPSGCGKTTLMRMLAGFETPDAGRILVEGQDVARLPPHARPINMMFQSYALFPHLTAAQNIAFGLKPQRLPRREIESRVEEMLALVRMEGLGGRKPHQLSGGQKQRVALARAIAPRPRILLLDEPLAALDKKLRDETQFELMRLQQELAMTFMIVTHDQEEAMVVADRLAVMRAGRIVQMGRPQEIYEAPANRYVAEFIGEVNLFHGHVAAQDGGLAQVTCGAPEGRLTVATDRGLEHQAEVWLAVRPEKVVMHTEPPPEGPNRLAGKIHDIAYLGDWTTYLVEVAPGRTVRAARANVARASARPVGWGDAVWMTFAPDAAVVLTS